MFHSGRVVDNKIILKELFVWLWFIFIYISCLGIGRDVGWFEHGNEHKRRKFLK